MKNIGAWNHEEIIATVRKELVEKPYFDKFSLDIDKFISCALFELRKTDLTNLGTSIFMLHPERPDDKIEENIKKSIVFNSGRIKFDNIVSFVNVNFTRGHFFEADLSDPDIMIEKICDIYNLGYFPSILLDNYQGEFTIRLYPNGFESDEIISLKLEKEVLDLISIEQAVERLHRSSLITPSANESANLKLWADSLKYYPEENIEKIIQGRLYSYFSANFGCNFLVLSEVTAAGGRLDLLLISKSNEEGKQINHAVLELKALRSFSNSGKTKYNSKHHAEWIEKGMRQALEYKNTHFPHHSILCCFDMSNSETNDDYWFNKTKKFSESNKITQWRWRIYNSAENKRKAEIKFSVE